MVTTAATDPSTYNQISRHNSDDAVAVDGVVCAAGGVITFWPILFTFYRFLFSSLITG